MEVRPVLSADSQVLAAVEARDADLATAASQLEAWDREGLRVPRVVVGIEGPPDADRVVSALDAHGIAGERLALAFPEGWLEADGMRDALDAARGRSGITAIVADFGSGAHSDVEFLVDYPADALALSPRIATGVGDDHAAAGRVRETCSVAAELGWRVIAADVTTPAEREALASAGVAEVTGPAIAEFTDAGALGPYLSRLRVTIPPGPTPSRRQRQPAAPIAAEASAPATAVAVGAGTKPRTAVTTAREAAEPKGDEHLTPWSKPRGESAIKREPGIASRLGRPIAAESASAFPGGARGSPGRSRPPRGEEGASRSRGSRLLLIFFLALVLTLIAYAVLAYLGHVPDPLGIEDISL